ncbi:MAG: DNA repair protein RadC [Candidatus Omnitrophica bacterium]|nr:DNA repair protein RadC [Candidatus Omnitrophota bacterium]
MVIRNWPKEDRPREKLLSKGEHTLTDSELLAIILETGGRGASALDLARRILSSFKTFRQIGRADLCNLYDIKGLDNAKVSRIRAVIEITKRFCEERLEEKGVRVKSSCDVVNILMPRMQDLKIEVFNIVLLNSQNRIIGITEIERGSVNQARPIIREVYQKALRDMASFIICVHNHPSGNPQPSCEDKRFTRVVVKVGKCLSLKCLDHIIIGNGKYFSFSDRGLI